MTAAEAAEAELARRAADGDRDAAAVPAARVPATGAAGGHRAAGGGRPARRGDRRGARHVRRGGPGRPVAGAGPAAQAGPGGTRGGAHVTPPAPEPVDLAVVAADDALL